MFVLDGQLRENDWQAYIPQDELPVMINPQRGYIRSANEHPVTEQYKYFPGWYFDDPYRARRIRERLEAQRDHSWQSMQDTQNDITDTFAREVAPLLIKNLTKDSLNHGQQQALANLKEWDFILNYDSSLPSIFYVWWRNVRDSIWRDQLWESERPMRPPRSRTLALIKDVDRKGEKAHSFNLFWLDDITTPQQENLSDIVTSAFLTMWKELTEHFGEDFLQWQWHKVNTTQIPHVGQIPGFGSDKILMGGGNNTPNANVGAHGASWKMVVEMSNPIQAWTNIPGGISGNPFDPTYDKWVESWSRGEMRSVRFGTLNKLKAEFKTTVFRGDE